MSYPRESHSWNSSSLKRSLFKVITDRAKNESETESYMISSPLIYEEIRDKSFSLKPEHDYYENQRINRFRSFQNWRRVFYIISLLIFFMNAAALVFLSEIIYSFQINHLACQTVKYSFLWLIGLICIGDLILMIGLFASYIESKSLLITYIIISIIWAFIVEIFAYDYIPIGYNKVKDCTQGLKSLTIKDYTILNVIYCTANFLTTISAIKVWYTLRNKVKSILILNKFVSNFDVK